MKTAKRKFFHTLIVLSFIIMQFTMSVHAGELEQSEQTVSATLYHEHTQEECFDRKWIPCGGWWRSYFESYVGATVYACTNTTSTEIRNGVRLSDIHYGWNYSEHTGVHEGEYKNVIICDQTVAGTFTVTKAAADTEAELIASVSSQGTGISEASFSWQCPDRSVVEGERVAISQNGIYCATLYWRDAKTGASHTSTLEYVEISNPVTLLFQSGGKRLGEIEVSYGDPLPEIEVPVREGYDFKGYYAGVADEEVNSGESGEENEDAAAWYDENGNPDSTITVTGSALEKTLTAEWEARSYHVYYGEDQEIDVTYGEEYGPVEIVVQEKEGYVFDGYYLGNEQVFDPDGNAAGVWHWDEEGDIILEAVYHKKTSSSSDQGGYDDTHNEGEDKDNDIVLTLSGRVSGNAVSGNGISGNGVSENSISENSISMNHISGNGISDHGTSAGGYTASAQEHTGGYADGGSRTGNYGERGDGDIRLSDDRMASDQDNGGADAAADEIVTQEIVSHLLSGNTASKRTAEAGMLRNTSAAVRALEVTSITAGTLGLLYLFVWMIITKASLAELQSVRADGSKRRLGSALILHGENAFHIRIRDRMLEKGETGRYQIIFRKRFAVKHANQDMIIHCQEKEIAEVIRPEVMFYIE